MPPRRFTRAMKVSAMLAVGGCSACTVNADIRVTQDIATDYPGFAATMPAGSFPDPGEFGASAIQLCVAGSPPEVCRDSAVIAPEAYEIRRSGETLYVIGSDSRGALHGASHLQQSASDASALQLPLVASPDFEIRALHIVIRNISLSDAKRLVDQARLARLNTLIVQIADYVDLGIAGWPVQKGAWSVAELQQFARYVRSIGLEFIPELKLLTHQEKFFAGSFPRLMYNKVTYDPRNPEVYEHVFGYLDKLIAAVEPEIVHIGHDEAFGFSERTHKKWLAPGEKPLPADLFLADVRKLHAYLTDRNIVVWMWADMLISPDESALAGMFDNELHGWGDYPSVREKLPKSIVMVDWHYSQKQNCFPSLKLLQAAGYRTLGSTWDRESTTDRFARYASVSGAPGMVQTLWNYVQRRRWAETDAMIAYAGAKYWDTGNTDPVAAECGLVAP